jgi:uncharacterized protein (TIGR02246 family)
MTMSQPTHTDAPTCTEPGQLLDAFAAAVNAKDAEGLGALFAEDGEYVNIFGMRMRGRRGVVDGHAWAFSGPLRGRRIRFDQVDELKVTDDVTVLHGHNLREREPGAPETGLPDGATIIVFVTRRGPRGWQIVAATNVADAPPPGR